MLFRPLLWITSGFPVDISVPSYRQVSLLQMNGVQNDWCEALRAPATVRGIALAMENPVLRAAARE